MRIRGIDHVQLAMPKGGEEEARRFYGGVLGLEEIPKPEALRARGGCWFRGGGAELHLGVEDDFRPARKAHPALRVDDFDAALAALGGDPDESIPGMRRFFVHDPFGNRLEIGAFRACGPCANLLVPDVDAALPWYTDKLGFETVRPLPGPPPGALLQLDGMPLLIEQTEGEIVPKSTHDPFGLDALFLVRDVHEFHEGLRERGTAREPLPEEARDCAVRTPEGYIVVFSAAL